MASERQNQTLADYVALALSPALIMGLVASLVFFLINVLYVGEFVERMRWILFFFVFGAVLLARMTMLDDTASRVALYGVPLGFLSWLGMQMFVEYPAGGVRELSFILNAGLIGLVWWCAHRLTWDCTNIDEEADMNAEGLLQASGLQGEPAALAAGSSEAGSPNPAANAAGSPGWLQRWRAYRAEREKKRTLGVWVVYFSLAALPLFGLGQALIPADDVDRRRSSFWLILVYVGCGLGLLLTTCFLSLRRYLRQRRLQMPATMTGVWLTSGSLSIAALLLIAALMPRPQAEYSLFSFAAAKASQRNASQYAMKGGQPGKGEGRPDGDNPDRKNDSADSGGDRGQQKGERGAANEQGDKGSGGKDGKSSQSGDRQSQSQGGQSNDPKQSKGDPGSGRDRPADKGDGERARGDQKGESTEKDASGQTRSGSSSKLSPSALRNVVGRIAPVLKWIVFALLALAAAFFVLRSGLQFWANFSDWARRLLDALRNFWANLFGGPRRTTDEEESSVSEEDRPRERPFASFRNPFVEGRRGMAVPELIRYTFAAAQAWARERDLGRHPGETPLEFAARVGAEVPALEQELHRLALLYARAVYANGDLPSDSVERLRKFWDRLQTVAEQPLSA